MAVRLPKEECPSASPPEKLYLVCDCGEAFDTLETAANHACDEVETYFRILPESEAL